MTRQGLLHRLRSILCILPIMMLLAPASGSAREAERTAQIPSADEAPIAFLFDMTSEQVLFERESDRRFLPASITKVMTTFLAFEWMEEGRIAPQQLFTIRPEVWRAWNNVGSTMFLPHDARVTVDDLLHGVTTVSANDGAAALADGAAGSVEAWVDAMNEKAADVGMVDSRFGTPNGWMDEGRTFTTARDLATLATHMVRRHPGKYRHYIGNSEFTFNDITQPNHDPISGVVPGADGIKTGFTNQAGFGFLGSAERKGRRLVVVVAGSEDVRARNVAARDLLEWGFGSFDQHRLFAPDVPVAQAAVQEGASRSVDLVAPRGIFIDMPVGPRRDISMQVTYDGPLPAPIAKGEHVANLTLAVEGMADVTVPLLASEAVPEAGVFDRVLNGLLGWFN